jgi:hypothetical protein
MGGEPRHLKLRMHVTFVKSGLGMQFAQLVRMLDIAAVTLDPAGLCRAEAFRYEFTHSTP